MFPQERALTSPDQFRQTDHRPLKSVVLAPHVSFAYPDDLEYKDTQMPTVPGNANVTLGCDMVLYTDSNIWDRGRTSLAGPVVEFFRQMMNGSRKVKQA